MNYIDYEEFRKQSEKAQEELIDFCKESFCLTYFDGAIRYNLFTKLFTPLMQMYQLVKFAEEKTGCVFDTIIEERNLEDTKWNYRFNAYKYNTEEGFEILKCYRVEAEDLLQAWWQVAIKIVEEE